MAIKIYLSPSNQDKNIYSDGRNECEVCYACASHLYDLLSKHEEFIVYLGRMHDNIATRVSESNAYGCDYHIPIHTNAGGGEGTRVFVYPTNKENNLAKCVLESVGEWSVGKIDKIVTNNTFYEIVKTTALCCYIEGEFHDTNGKHIDAKEYAQAIYRGILKAFNIPQKISNENSSEIYRGDGDSKYYRVQLGAFAIRKNAEDMARTLKEKGYNVYIDYH